jgi:perosamine synthetase
MSASPYERHLRDAPVIESYDETGFNYRMTDMQAAMGRVQLTRLEAMVARRRALAARYRELLSEIPGLQCVDDPPWGKTNYQTFWVVLPDDFPVPRNAMLSLLQQHGVQARHGVTAIHLEPAFSDLRPADLLVTERVARQSILVPMFHELRDDDQLIVAEAFHAAAHQRPTVRQEGVTC